MLRQSDMLISIMCNPATAHPAGRESQRICGHTFHDKGQHHLSFDRQRALCGIDCGEFVYITKVEVREFVPNDGICSSCVEKLS
jgi:hypothetical protein